MMVVAWILGWYLLYPYEFKALGKHLMGGNAFISNFILWFESGYFDISSESKPLMHLWSLGIEEQFYIIWPILFIFLWRFRKSIPIILLLIGIISFLLNIYLLNLSLPAHAYFLPISRFWELMIGGGIAFLTYKKSILIYCSKRYIANSLAFIGGIFILYSMLCLSSTFAFPGVWALFPTLGATFFILSPESFLNRKILSCKSFVYIGKISYPLYLWHWLFLSFMYILKFYSLPAKITCLLISGIFSVITYEFLEKKIKRFNGNFLISILVLISIIILILGFFTYQGYIPPRHDSRQFDIIGSAINDWTFPNGLKKTKIYGLTAYTKGDDYEYVLYVGDSHMQQYAPRVAFLIDNYPKRCYSAVFLTVQGAVPIPNVFLEKAPSSLDFFTKMNEFLSDKNLKRVVFSASWNFLFNHAESDYYVMHNNKKHFFKDNGIELAIDKLKSLIKQISSKKQIYFITDNPSSDKINPKNILNPNRLAPISIDEKHLLPKSVIVSLKGIELHRKLAQIALSADAEVIMPDKYLLDKNNKAFCVYENEKPIYIDGYHLRANYVRKYAIFMDRTIFKIKLLEDEDR